MSNVKSLIITADDYGLCRSINLASLEALRKGCVTSLSIMPCAPYFRQAVRLAHKYAIKHAGVHLTLLSEFPNLRWAPVTPKQRVKSLVDKSGYLHKTIRDFAKHARTDEILIELERQIKKVIRCGLIPTHLDCHMFSLHSKVSKRPDLIPLASQLCKKYKLPFRSPFKKESVFLKKNSVKILSKSFWHTYDIPARRKRQEYDKIIKNLRPGISELILHCGFDDTELKNITAVSSRRQADLDYALSEDTKRLLNENGVSLMSWADMA